MPFGVMMALSVTLGRVALPLHPLWSARLLSTTGVMTVVAAFGTGVFVAVNYGATLAPEAAAHVPEWALFGDDRPVPAWAGIPAIVLSAAGLLVAARLAVRWVIDLRAAQADAGRPLDTEVPIAVAVPGRRGGVLLSRGLLTRLTARELQVVFEHERSHLRHRHHRYLAAGALAAALLPPLRALNDRLRLSVERWADEDAAEAVGDRRLVARTIAKVALAQCPDGRHGPAIAFAWCGVVERVEALLATPPDKNTVSGPLLFVGHGLVTGSLAALTLQLDRAIASALFPTLIIR
ncbi:MAG: M48 family metalloprotease [Actinomadura rubrobrunea]|nr:M48 family metalloprotease [Actinomadura rubrobrunea]